MKALVLHAVNDLRYEEVPDSERRHGEVLIKIKASGICGSDIPRIFEKGTYHFPTIPGHEFSGEIIGADSADLIGKKCTVYPLVPCQACDYCQVGKYAQCSGYNYFGSRCDGGFAELISVPLWNVVLAPDDLSFEEIAMAEPCSVALHSLEKADLRAGGSVCVFGAGPIGIMAGKWAFIKGASTVSLIDIDDRKAAFAKELGFQTDVSGKYDAVLECSGSSSGFENAVSVARPFGTVVLVGNPAGQMALSQKGYWEILRKEVTLKGVWNSSYNSGVNDWKTSLEYMARLDLSSLVSHRFRYSQCHEAFSMMKERKEFACKAMFVND
jgi:L-iditol 2-dehydrogenase